MKNLTVLQFTIILLIGLGILMRKLGIVSKEGQKNMTDLVINLILPCNIVASFMGDIDPETISQCLLVFLISVAIQTATAVYGIFAYRGENEARKKNLRYAIMCSNAGFMGSTIAEGVFGAEGLMLSSIYLIPQRVVMWSAGIAIFSGEVDKKKTLKKGITHPCVIACFVGIFIMLTQIPVPDYISTPITTIGRCNTALPADRRYNSLRRGSERQTGTLDHPLLSRASASCAARCTDRMPAASFSGSDDRSLGSPCCHACWRFNRYAGRQVRPGSGLRYENDPFLHAVLRAVHLPVDTAGDIRGCSLLLLIPYPAQCRR